MAEKSQELDEALAGAAMACARRAQETAEGGAGKAVVAELWASAAAQLAFAAKGVGVGLPARPGG
jgi:hypothetical protein